MFAPAYAIYASGLLPDGFAMAGALAIVTTSALYFADNKMKMDDNHFRGFPAIWNTAAFYLLLIAPSPMFSVLFIGAFVVMTFLPIPFIHPMRVVKLRKFHIALLIVWSILALTAVLCDMAAGPFVTSILCLIGVYIVGGGYISASRMGKT